MLFKLFSEIDESQEKFIQACMKGEVKQVKTLVEQGVKINAINPEYGDTGLSQAALLGHKEIVDYLLTLENSSYSLNLALIFACQKGNVDIIKILLQHKADPNGYCPGYQTPLFQVITQNKPDALTCLLESKAINVNLEDKDGIIPLHLAAYNGRLDMVKLLIQHRADLGKQNKDGYKVVDLASQKSHKDIVEFLKTVETTSNQALSSPAKKS